MCLSFRSIAFRALCPTAVAATYSIKSSRKALIVTACGKFKKGLAENEGGESAPHKPPQRESNMYNFGRSGRRRMK